MKRRVLGAFALILCLGVGCEHEGGHRITGTDDFSPIAASGGEFVNHEDNLFYCNLNNFPFGPAVPYRDEAYHDRNVVHLGGEENPLEMIILIGEPGAAYDECTVIYIYECLLPGNNDLTIAKKVWRILDSKTTPRFSERPVGQRYSTMGVYTTAEGQRPNPGKKVAAIEYDVLMACLGLETQGPDFWTLGRKPIVRDETGRVLTRFWYWHPGDLNPE